MELNVVVRRILVRHWVDLGKVSIRTTRGVVWLSGSLVRLRNGGTEMRPDEMQGIFDEIRAVHGIRRMHPRLLNWDGKDPDLSEGDALEQPNGVRSGRVEKSSQAVSTYTVKETNSVSYRELVEALNKASNPQRPPPNKPLSSENK